MAEKLTSDEIFAKLKTVIVDVLNVEEDQVELKSKYVEDLGAESLDLMTMIMELEDVFGNEIPDADIVGLTSVEATISYIEQKFQ
jgi:acyl carrier protein